MFRQFKDSKHTIDGDLAKLFPKSGPIWAWMHYACRLTQTPPTFHLGAILPMASHLLIEQRYRRDERDKLQLNLWAMLAGPSGHSKSQAYTMAHDVMIAVHAECSITNAFVSTEGTLPGALASIWEKYDPDKDITNVILVQEEFSNMLVQTDTSQKLCGLCDSGNTFDRNQRNLQEKDAERRKAGGTGDRSYTIIKKPRINAVFCAATEMLEEKFKLEHFSGGLASRMLWFVAELDEDKLMPKTLLDQDEDGFKTICLEFIAWVHWMQSMMDGERIFKFDVAAEEHIDNELFEKRRKDIAGPLAQKRISSIAARLAGIGRRIACIYAASERSTTVRYEHAVAAANLANHCYSSILVLAKTIAVNPGSKLRAQIEQVLEAAGEAGLNRRELFRRFRKHNKGEMVEAIDTLLESGDLVESRPPGKGRTPAVYHHPDFAARVS